MEAKEYFELARLLGDFRDVVETAFCDSVWVKAEISSLKARPGGHCYMELSQGDAKGSVVAKVRAVAWANVWRQIAPYFREETGSDLAEGMEVLVEVTVSFSEIYGLSLVIEDIDPSFTLGAVEDARRKTLERLEKEGLLDCQKKLDIPELPYRIAVISAEDAAGYRDFMRHLHGNEDGFVFSTTLIPALMQGVGAPASIAAALGTAAAGGFDIAAIIRGGGSRLDLACFDEYELCAAIASCPVPVMTAVGHDQDFHAADMTAAAFVKTPTALADLILDRYAAADAVIGSFATRLRLAFIGKIRTMESELALLQTRIKSADPRNILARGYTLALDADGKPAHSASSFRPGDVITVMFPDGTVRAIVESD